MYQYGWPLGLRTVNWFEAGLRIRQTTVNPIPGENWIYNNKKFSGDCPKATPPNVDPLMLKCSRGRRHRHAIPGVERYPKGKL